MNIQTILDDNDCVLAEAAVIETLRRSGNVELHPRLENALLIYEEAGKEALTVLYNNFIDVARKADIPIMISTPTWRAKLCLKQWASPWPWHKPISPTSSVSLSTKRGEFSTETASKALFVKSMLSVAGHLLAT